MIRVTIEVQHQGRTTIVEQEEETFSYMASSSVATVVARQADKASAAAQSAVKS